MPLRIDKQYLALFPSSSHNSYDNSDPVVNSTLHTYVSFFITSKKKTGFLSSQL